MVLIVFMLFFLCLPVHVLANDCSVHYGIDVPQEFCDIGLMSPGYPLSYVLPPSNSYSNRSYGGACLYSRSVTDSFTSGSYPVVLYFTVDAGDNSSNQVGRWGHDYYLPCRLPHIQYLGYRTVNSSVTCYGSTTSGTYWTLVYAVRGSWGGLNTTIETLPDGNYYNHTFTHYDLSRDALGNLVRTPVVYPLSSPTIVMAQSVNLSCESLRDNPPVSYAPWFTEYFHHDLLGRISPGYRWLLAFPHPFFADEIIYWEIPAYFIVPHCGSPKELWSFSLSYYDSVSRKMEPIPWWSGYPWWTLWGYESVNKPLSNIIPYYWNLTFDVSVSSLILPYTRWYVTAYYLGNNYTFIIDNTAINPPCSSMGSKGSGASGKGSGARGSGGGAKSQGGGGIEKRLF